jgi:hypothetical protein
MMNHSDRGGDTRREQEMRERMLRSIDSPSRAAAEPAATVVGASEDGECLLPVLWVCGPGKRGGGGEVGPPDPSTPRRISQSDRPSWTCRPRP